MLKIPSTAPLPSVVLHEYHLEFNSGVAAGSLRPLVLPYHLYGVIALIAYLSIPHTKRPWLYAARWPVLAGITAFQVKTLFETKSLVFGTGFGAGMVSIYGLLLAVTWLVFYRPQFTARRIERTDKVKKRTVSGTASHANGSTTSGALVTDSKIRDRTSAKSQSRQGETVAPKTGIAEPEPEYFWQSYPERLEERISWATDLICNQRGERWNWAIPTLPLRPAYVRQALGEEVPEEEAQREKDFGITASSGSYIFPSRNKLLRVSVARLAIGTFILDGIKTAMMNDHYFLLGPTDFALPRHLANLSPLLVTFYRQLLVFGGITTALEMGFMLQAVLLLGFSMIPEAKSIFGTRGEVWMYPTQWGTSNAVFTKGLNGLWGSWWHQTFRLVFAAPVDFLVSKGIIKARSTSAKLATLLSAFTISGIIHASGSIAQFPHTKPWHPFIFFILQALGIFIQTTACAIAKPQLSKVPTSIRKAGNIIFVFVWLSLTANWLVDDFARGGIWLIEPLPMSPLRLLGFGPEPIPWYLWKGSGFVWYQGEHWWESGFMMQ